MSVRSQARRFCGAACAALAVVAGGLVTTPAAAAAPVCSDVEIVGVRGTHEPAGVGPLMTPIAAVLTSRLEGLSVRTYGLPYPATDDFQRSASEGIRRLEQHVLLSSAICPGQRHVLMGYSQGAYVVDRAMALHPGVANVSAVLLFGNPRFTSAEPFAAGTFAPDSAGVLARPVGEVGSYATRIRDYCNVGDGVCQNTLPVLTPAHSDYRKYTDDAAAFVRSRLGR